MKSIYLIFAIFTTLISCNSDDYSPCECRIIGIEQSSNDGGETWTQTGIDGRSGETMWCALSGTYTEQTERKRIYWECQE